MKLLLLLLILGGVAILLISNPQPIVLYFLGTNSTTALFSLQLPLGIWVILASLVGIVTSFVIGGLNRSPARSTASAPQPRNLREPDPQPFYPPPATPQTDWDAAPKREGNPLPPLENDWNIEEPPVQTTIPSDRPFFQRQVPRYQERIADEMIEPGESPSFEVPQEPKTATRQGSVYSYTYRELRDSPPSPEPAPQLKQPSESVYDANYRVVTPPYRDKAGSTDLDGEEDEEWV